MQPTRKILNKYRTLCCLGKYVSVVLRYGEAGFPQGKKIMHKINYVNCKTYIWIYSMTVENANFSPRDKNFNEEKSCEHFGVKWSWHFNCAISWIELPFLHKRVTLPNISDLLCQEGSVWLHGKLTHCYPGGHPAFLLFSKKHMPWSCHTERSNQTPSFRTLLASPVLAATGP